MVQLATVQRVFKNPHANKSSKKKLKKLKEHTIPLKAKEAAIYGVNLFPKDKSTF
jgi:hypothetical protein